MDRNDRSTSLWGNIVFLFFRLLWLALIFLGYVQHPEYFVGLARALPLLGSYVASSPDIQRLACMGLCAAFFACRQIYWLLFFATGSFPPPIAAVIGVMIPAKFLLLSLAASAAPFGSAADAAGLLLFLTGMAVETVSEAQRKAFKDDPRNAGRPYGGGLFSLARHINYFGDAVAYAGYVLLASGSWAAAAAMAAFETAVFLNGSIPELSHHMAARWRRCAT